MTIHPNLILDALKNVRYPGSGKDIVEMNMVQDDIRIDGNKVSFSIFCQISGKSSRTSYFDLHKRRC